MHQVVCKFIGISDFSPAPDAGKLGVSKLNSDRRSQPFVVNHQQTDSDLRPGHSVASEREQKIPDSKTLIPSF